MSDDIDDINDFIDSSSEYKDTKVKASGKSIMDQIMDAEDDEPKLLGVPVQYSRYGAGYTATNETVPSLPSGCYDIHADQRCVFAVPALKQSGLLLDLPEMRSDDVIKLVERFWDSEKDYKEGNEFVIGGALYKSGVMLFGPPGSGKSTTLKIVCNRLVARGGTVFYASEHPSRVTSFLTDFSKIEKNRKCIVILEDIDSLIQNFGETYYLEMLDSAKTINNVLFIATTNYPDRLDPRIYNRPGRFSHVIKIGLPTPKAREAFLKAILKNHRDVDTIVRESEGFTIDHLSSLISGVYREKKELLSELKRLRTLFKVPKVDSDQDTISLGRK